MHQPWASLLVYGFKRAEGRSWKSDHRGRLWIHATAKAPDPAEIQALEERYSFIYEAAGVPIPSLPSKSGGYPTSALLGCVDVEACWSKSEYASVLEKNPSMPQEESESDFIFWCLRPRRLLVPLKMAGDHKIWRLEKSSLQPAQRGLQPVRWPRPQEGEKSMTSPAIEKSQAKEKPATAAAQRSAEAIEAQPNRTQVHLDLWPSEASERLELLDSSEKSAVVLQNGFVQLSGHLPWDLQQRIVDEMREIGIQSHGFSPEDFDGVKMSEGVHRMYLGLRWNSVARTWESSRVNHFVAALPKFLAEMYSDAVKSANREMQSAQNKRRKLQPFPEKAPTVAAVEFCPMASTVQLHQEKTETPEAIEQGFPIMGICLGASCELAYSSEAGASKPKVLRLRSGDLFLLGGEARLLWHGFQRIIPNSSPSNLRLQPGMLHLSLRVH
ncbi:unnamed protein product [Durusdinium trenchii]|uniref:Uncharacterized protein n=2 Tax=Durusdinium trenchii TaxID=1381693 RepID=A0ABP0RSY7_9DINO